MALSIDWNTFIITVPKADTTLVDIGPPEIREYDVNTFRLALKDLEDDPDGMGYTKTHTHDTEVELSGVTYARKIIMLAPYSVEFEDGSYTVNLFGANHNILDRHVQNSVGVTTQNSAGLVVLTGLQERQDYGGYVRLDTVNGTAATEIAHPWGTADSPVDNFSDAAAIAAALGIDTIRVRNTPGTPVDLDVDVSYLRVESLTGGAEANLVSGNDVTGTSFVGLELFGAASATDDFFLDRCLLYGGMTGLRGVAWNCALHENSGNFTIEYAADFALHSLDSGVPGTSHPILSKESGAGTVDLQVRGLRGGLGIDGTETGDMISVDILSGSLTIESGCTGGTFKVRGGGESIVQNGTVDTLDADGYLVAGDMRHVKLIPALL